MTRLTGPWRPWQVQVYRVEGLQNQRLLIDARGRVSLGGGTMLFLNFGQYERAREFWVRRRFQGFVGVELRGFRVRRRDLRRLRSLAVPERLAGSYPDRPLEVDIEWPDQF